MLVARTFSLGIHFTPLSVEKFMAFKMYSALHIHSSQTQRFPSGSPNNNSRQLKSWGAFFGPTRNSPPPSSAAGSCSTEPKPSWPASKKRESPLWLLTDEERPTGGVAFQELIKRNGQIVIRDHSAPSVHRSR